MFVRSFVRALSAIRPHAHEAFLSPTGSGEERRFNTAATYPPSGPVASQREKNLRIYGGNNATHARGVALAVSCFRHSDYEVKRLPEGISVPLIFRRCGSPLWAGLHVRVSTSRDAAGAYRFNKAKVLDDQLVLFIGAGGDEPRCWITLGQEILAKKVTLSVRGRGKYVKYAVNPGRIMDRIADHWQMNQVSLRPEEIWTFPVSKSHQKEHRLHTEAAERLFHPMGWEVGRPEEHGTVVDFTLDGLRVQSKVAQEVKNRRVLQVDIFKNGGRVNGKPSKQPYAVCDIDLFLIYVTKCGSLSGCFVIPRDEAVERGWLRGGGYRGLTTIHLYPPFVRAQKAFESKQKRDLTFYLDFENLDIRRAKQLFDNCREDAPRGQG